LIEEGVSRNYLPGLNKSQPSNALFERLRKNPNIIRLNPKIAGTRTTDSPFMQKTSEIEELLHQGICCTDMEASALFTVANYRGVHLASIFYVTDTYTNKQWTPKARDKQVNSIIDRLNAAVLSLWKEN
jgi:purine-nucleoside phosphorylase